MKKKSPSVEELISLLREAEKVAKDQNRSVGVSDREEEKAIVWKMLTQESDGECWKWGTSIVVDPDGTCFLMPEE